MPLEHSENAKRPSRLDELSSDATVQSVLELARRAAPTPATIMLLGESGTGKSLLARAIHRESPFRQRPFVTVMCPCLSEQLLESELFGHRRGAFTGAVRDHTGKVAAAEGGTLFLDEIGELPAAIQPKLLRLLQEREYERVGGTTVHRARIRVIAATNRDLAKRIADGEFREDLYYRLNVVSLDLPPLRERPNDLLRTTANLLSRFGNEFGKSGLSLARDARQILALHEWPGNFRELENVLQRAVVGCKGNTIRSADLGLDGTRPDGRDSQPEVGSRVSLRDLEAFHIREIVRKTPTLGDAAEVLGIDASTLFRKRKQYAI